MSNNNYVYPKGDFLSGFSEGGEICDYELACQTMVVRGMNYIDEHPEMKEILLKAKNVFDDELKPLTDVMVYGIDPSGAMVSQSVRHLIYPQKHGWEKYISEITKSN